MIRMKAIQPRDFKTADFLKVIGKEARNVGQEIQRQYGRFVETWEHDVRFALKVNVTIEQVEILVTTKDKIFRWVSKGTPPHVIRVKHARSLVFRSGFKPKTRRGLVGSNAGGVSGETLYRRSVRHPGIEPREFDKTIATIWKRVMRKRFRDALNRAALASGHALRR